MEKVAKIFKNPMELLVGIAGLGLLAFYILYFRKQYKNDKKPRPIKNKLNCNLRQLIDGCKHSNVIKIVITQSKFNGSRQFRSKLITRLNHFLKQQNLNTLVNCSPIKLFNDSAQVLIKTLKQIYPENQDQWMSYLYNALKCQLVIQKIIVDIYKIKRGNQKLLMICDSNSMDIQTECQQNIWKKFLKQQNIKQKQLMNNYQIVFHLKSNVGIQGYQLTGQRQWEHFQNCKIQQVWKMFEQYFPIVYQSNCILQQNIQIALEYIINKLKPYLPESVHYKKRQVFAKQF